MTLTFALSVRRVVATGLLLLGVAAALIGVGAGAAHADHAVNPQGTMQSLFGTDADEEAPVPPPSLQRVLPNAPAQPVAPTPPVSPEPAEGAGSVNINVGGKPSNAVTLILALTVLSVAPSLLLLMTSFTKIIVVLSLTRNALGLPTSPPNQVLTGIALFLTLFIMAPVFSEINDLAIQPYLNGHFNAAQAYHAGVDPLREFLMHNTRADELKLMVDLSGQDMPADTSQVSMSTLIPAFVLSELKAAFIIGLVIFIPFLVLDMLVAATLMSMGMMMVPPVMVSLPFKLLLFVMVDGWALITTALVQSYR